MKDEFEWKRDTNFLDYVSLDEAFGKLKFIKGVSIFNDATSMYRSRELSIAQTILRKDFNKEYIQSHFLYLANPQQHTLIVKLLNSFFIENHSAIEGSYNKLPNNISKLINEFISVKLFENQIDGGLSFSLPSLMDLIPRNQALVTIEKKYFDELAPYNIPRFYHHIEVNKFGLFEEIKFELWRPGANHPRSIIDSLTSDSIYWDKHSNYRDFKGNILMRHSYEVLMRIISELSKQFNTEDIIQKYHINGRIDYSKYGLTYEEREVHNKGRDSTTTYYTVILPDVGSISAQDFKLGMSMLYNGMLFLDASRKNSF